MSNITVRINDETTLEEQWSSIMRNNYVLALSITNDIQPIILYGSIECLGNTVPAGLIQKIHGGKLTGAIFVEKPDKYEIDELLTGNIVDCKSQGEHLRIASVSGSRITWCSGLVIDSVVNSVFDNSNVFRIGRADNCKFVNCEFTGLSTHFENCIFQACKIKIGHGFTGSAHNCVFDRCVFLYNSPFSIIEHGVTLTFIACKFHGTGAKNLITHSEGELKITICEISGANFDTIVKQATGTITIMGLTLLNSHVRSFVDESDASSLTMSRVQCENSEFMTFLGVLTDRGILSLNGIAIKTKVLIHSARRVHMMLSTLVLRDISIFCDQLCECTVSFDDITLHAGILLKFFESVTGSRIEGRNIRFNATNLQLARTITNRSDIMIEDARSTALKIHQIDIDETSVFNGECQNEAT